MTRCLACDPNCRLVSPTGPCPADIMFIGEKPGQQEAYLGRVFVGDTGKELNDLYLPLAGLNRRQVRISNCVKCRLGDSNSKPTPAQINTCASHHLPAEIYNTYPSVIVLLGSTACSLLPDIDLEKQHGLPFLYDGQSPQYFGSWAGWIVPFYHPAAALHSTSMMIPLLDDFRRLRLWLESNWIPPSSDIPTDYSLVSTCDDLGRQFSSPISYSYIPIDTESDGPRPWSLQFSLRPGHGAMIMAQDRLLISAFSQLISKYGLLLHHSIADLDPLEEMGLSTSGRPIRDTMQELYHLGNQPQGLKSAVYRLLGLKMRSWEDLVLPPSRQKMTQWLLDQWLVEGENKIKVDIKLKTKVKSVYKANPMERALKRILSHSHKPAYDLWEKASESELTGFPIRSIAHAPLDEAINYGCADADLTGRVGSWLENERARIVEQEWNVAVEDEDL